MVMGSSVVDAENTPSSRRLPPGPVVTLANATSVVTVHLYPAAAAFILTLDTPANVASLTVRGAASGALLATYAAAPTVSYIVLPVAPALDGDITVTLTAAAGGPVSLNLAESYAAAGSRIV